VVPRTSFFSGFATFFGKGRKNTGG
jgi:hypothetical protein